MTRHIQPKVNDSRRLSLMKKKLDLVPQPLLAPVDAQSKSIGYDYILVHKKTGGPKVFMVKQMPLHSQNNKT